jgi:protein-disulfide isomerase
MERDDINFVFAHLPAKENTHFISNILNCVNEMNKTKFIDFNNIMFSSEFNVIENEEKTLEVVERIGLDKEIVRQCSYSEKIQNLSKQQFFELQKTGVYGTPTIFINGEAVVGPKPYRVYTRLLR